MVSVVQKTRQMSSCLCGEFKPNRPDTELKAEANELGMIASRKQVGGHIGCPVDVRAVYLPPLGESGGRAAYTLTC